MSGTGAGPRPRAGRTGTVVAGLVAVVLAVVGYLVVDPADRAGPASAPTAATASAAPGPGPGTTGTRAPGSGSSGTGSPGPSAPGADGLAVVALGSLPVEARRTVTLIDAGGPFPYARDGVVFGNRERLLPRRPSGWYREYTVPTPGEDDRGPRRIVTGDDGRELFWTVDHYASFVRVRR